MKNINTHIKSLFVKIPALSVLILALASCHKRQEDNIKPLVSVASFDTAAYHLNYSVNSQIVKLSVTNDTLKLVYNEDVKIIADSANYKNSYAIHVVEDFSKSQLKNYNYNTTTKGITVYDWVEDNLNNVDLTAVTDTVINHKTYAKIELKRNFIFFKPFNNAADATAEQKRLLAVKTDLMSFSSYFFYLKDYPATNISVPLVYVSDGQ